MSLFIQSATGASGVTVDRGAGIYGVNPCPYQIEKENSFNPSTAVPGQKVDIKLNMISKEIFKNLDLNIVFTVNTSDSTNHATWKNICTAFCQKTAY